MSSTSPLTDFFTSGGTLPPDAPSYVKRPADDELLRYLSAGRFCSVLTPRQMGKSSLMTRTAKRLREQGVKTAIVDLTQIGTVEDPDTWYRGILIQIRRHLNPALDPILWWDRTRGISSHQKFFEFFRALLSEIEEKVVIFIDEIDMTLERSFRDDFFVGIRSMYNARADQPEFNRLTFVLLGVASPVDLIQDRNRTPYNIGQEVALEPFSRIDAQILEQGLAEVYPRQGKQILDRIFYWTSGHPYLTQRLCRAVVENRLTGSRGDGIDEQVEKLFLSAEAIRELNLQFVRENILHSAERQEMLAIYEKLLLISEKTKKGDSTERIEEDKIRVSHNRLKLSGLVTAKNGALVISNLIYQTVFDLEWVKRSRQQLVGRRLRNYVVLEVLSHRQWGSSLKARNERTGELVVLKAFEQGTLTGGAQETPRAEIKRLKELERGRGIQLPRETFEQDGTFFIVSDYVEGGNLQQRLTKGLSAEEILNIFSQIAQTIDYIHSRNFIHRDIKPENILCEDTKGKINIHLTDFEIAKVLDSSPSAYSTETASGSLLYMAPEMFDRAATQTKATDIYSFGVMLYEALEGRVPFESLSAKLNELAPYPERIENLSNFTSVELLLSALDQDPEKRPESARNIIDKIRNAYDERSRDRNWIGHRIRNYSVVEVLGHRELGVTLRVQDERGEQVVLKAFEADAFLSRPKPIFDKEMDLLGRLGSAQGVLLPQESFLQEGMFFIATHYLSGGSLRRLLNENRSGIDVERIVEVFTQIANALDHVHSRGIVHRSLKPENVLCRQEAGRTNVYLTDFGTARILETTKPAFAAKATAGSSHYLAPEAWDPLARKTKAMDIYSFGVMLYEALEGHVPFRAEYPKVISQHKNELVPEPRNTLRKRGSVAANILLEALAKRAEDRPRTAKEIMERIRGQQPDYVGKKYGAYEIVRLLGQSENGITYKAIDTANNRRSVALKTFPFVELLYEEVQILKKVEGRTGILPLLDHGVEGGVPYLVTEYMSGGNLRDLLEEFPNGMGLEKTLEIFKPIATALDYLHSIHIVHRDLKPENIILKTVEVSEKTTFQPYITDFGISRVLEKTPSVHTQTSIAAGTYKYIAPETWNDQMPAPANDIYALGIMIYEALEGEPPFKARTPASLMRQHLNNRPPIPKNLQRSHGPKTANVLLKSLDKKPEQRQKTALELIHGLEKASRDHTTSLARVFTRPVFQFMGLFLVLAFLGFAIWKYPGSTPLMTPPTPQPATATLVPSTPTSLPTVTATPTEVVTPTIPVDPGIGGANKIALTSKNEIYLMDMDGENIQQLTNTNQAKFDLQWLPGGHELVYGEANCAYKINVEASQPKPEVITCFTDPKFEGFRVSPDGRYVAISIQRRLLVVPFDLQALSSLSTTFELQNLKGLCIDYSIVPVKSARWSPDGQELAIVYQSVIGQRLGDVVRVLTVDMVRCQQSKPAILAEFPSDSFLPEGYERYPIMPSYGWDGSQRFVFNTFKRNTNYGELYLYDLSTSAMRKINPIAGVCCYGSASFSPDGTHILLVFQDIRRGADSETELYYIPIDQIGAGQTFIPLKLPSLFFREPRENIQLALRPSAP